MILQQQLGQQLSSLQKLNQQLSAAVPWQMELYGKWLLMVNNIIVVMLFIIIVIIVVHGDIW